MSEKWGTFELDLKPQKGNQHNSQGITAREAKQIYEMARKLQKIQDKPNLFIGYSSMIQDLKDKMKELLIRSSRLKKIE